MARMAARALAVGLMAAMALIALVGSAAAHARLVSATPAAGATLSSAPPVVRLEFDEAPYGIGVGVVVTSPSGGTVTQGRAQVDGNTVVASLSALTAGGTYTVAWRIVSADGHPVSGDYTFTYAPEGAAGTSAPAASSTTGGHGWVLLGVAVLAVIGLCVLLILPRRRHGPAPREHPLP